VLVVEDVHWADEATLDLLGLVARRIEHTAAVLVASFRDDELGQVEPVRIALGELTALGAAASLRLPPLSSAAVRMLAEPFGADAEELHRITGGNAFFVSEVLAAGSERIPPTVREAVLARAARAGRVGRRLLDAAAVLAAPAELALLEAVAGDDIAGLDDCYACGMLRDEDGLVCFRHELARLAVEESIPPRRRRALHAAALRAIAGHACTPDPAVLAHHGEGSRDTEAVLRYAPAAAELAASLGAHREAASQLARALRFGDGLPPERRAELLERRTDECFLADEPEPALESEREALGCHRALGDALREGRSLSRLARLYSFCSRDVEADEAALEAVELLERRPPGRELASVYSILANMRMLSGDRREAVAWGERAIELAARLDEREILAYALNGVGSVEFHSGKPAGRAKLEQSLEIALADGLTQHVVRAYVNLASTAVDIRSYDVADHYLTAGLAHAGEHEIAAWRWYLTAVRARAELERGRWDDAVETARVVLTAARPTSFARLTALTVLGRIRARRGEPDPWPLLDEARDIALLNAHLQLVGPVACARAEAAGLDGDLERVGPETEECIELAARLEDPWILGELCFWRRVSGVDDQPPGDVAEPFALQLAGDWARADACWAAIGCPYEAALSLAESADPQAARRALAELGRLGASRTSAVVTRRLRRRGVRNLPRGPRRATRRNPAGLTCRELEVLGLMVDGMRNTDIATHLVLSTKTVEHHVSSILRKLGVSSRREAVAAAPHELTET
jgi:DNA-binding CsgD family transcriptional regulator/tetratricopeptide (TPR) repeat protein